MLGAMYPRQYQDQRQQQFNAASLQYQQNYGTTYSGQSRIQPQDYALSHRNDANHLQKQSAVQNRNYVALRPMPAANTSGAQTTLVSPGNNFSPLQYGTSIPNLSQRAANPSHSLHWSESSSSQVPRNVQPVTRNPQPLVQQTLSHLGIPQSMANLTHLPQNHDALETGARQVSHRQVNPLHPLPRRSISNQAVNLSSSQVPGLHNRNIHDVLPATLINTNSTHLSRTSTAHNTNIVNIPNSMRNSLGMQASNNYARQISEPSSREKVQISFGNKIQTPPTSARLSATPSPAARKRSTSNVSDTSSNKDDAPAKNKAKLELDDDTRIVIDDDIEIVGCKQAEIMSHSRADCPVYRFVRIDSVTKPGVPTNIKSCEKCFCYICDLRASQCKQWTDSNCAHCNAHSKASCWKARRNMKKSPLMNVLTAEEITPSISEAGEKAVKYIIKIRETYITYRAGIPCDFHQVPCDCSCHRDSKLKPEGCVSCKAVHDLKKRFNYDPVRKIIYGLLEDINLQYSEKPFAALVLYEALLSELCTHRPADFNHVTRIPSNPDVNCQCTTPQIMDDRIEPALLRLFTLNEVSKAMKDKFLTCVNNSIQPLQLKDVMKKFLGMRHWDDLLLRAVLSGQNTTGRAKANDVLKESAQVIEMRVQKLDKEKRFHSIIRYLKAVKVIKPPKQYDGAPFPITIEKWLLYYTAKDGRFRDACTKLMCSTNLMKSLPPDYMLDLLSILSGQTVPPTTEMVCSFNGIHNDRTRGYQLSGADPTALLLLFVVYMEVNVTASLDPKCYLWLARWTNRQSVPNIPSTVNAWIKAATQLVIKVASQLVAVGEQHRREQFVLCSTPLDHQVSLFVCSLLVLRFFTRLTSNLNYVEEFIDAFKNNGWVLFYLFCQNAMLCSGNRHVVSWLIKYMGENECNIAQFGQEALSLFIQKSEINDVYLFMKPLLSSDWSKQPIQARQVSVKTAAKFAIRLVNEPKTSCHDEASKFLNDVVLNQIVATSLSHNDEAAPYCDVVGKCCCMSDISALSAYKKFFHPTQWPVKCAEIFAFYEQKLTRNALNTDEVTTLLRLAVREGNQSTVRAVFARLTDKHECSSPTGSKVMSEVISILDSSDNFEMNKSNLMAYYTKLCSHETLSWLICAVCSSKMPEGWMGVWTALERNDMSELLRILVQHTLQQFTTWMKELAVQEESDVQRLLRCLDVFARNVVKTLIGCKFTRPELQSMLLDTRFFIADTRLRNEYMKIVQNVFPPEASHSPPRILTPEIPPKPSPNTSSPAKSPMTRTPPVTTPPRVTSLSKADKISSSPPHSPEIGTSPSFSVMSPAGNSQNSGSDVTSPRVCPRCGDAMTSSFKCSRCHIRQNREVTCPNCGQINRDLKDYNCRFCYESLLTVLTGAEPIRSPEPTTSANSFEKRKLKLKKKKKKRLEKQMSKDLSEDAEPTRTSLPTERNHTKIVLQKMKSTPEDGDVLKHDFQVKRACSYQENIELVPKPALKIKINPTSKTTEARNHGKKSRILSAEQSSDKNLSDSEDFDNDLNFYGNVRKWSHEAKRRRDFHPVEIKKRNNAETSALIKSPNRPIQQAHASSTNTEGGGIADPKIPPLILKRKSDDLSGPAGKNSNKSPEQKRSKTDGVKRPVNKGLSMSKKQRDILQRMKGCGQPKKVSIKSSSVTPSVTLLSPPSNPTAPTKTSPIRNCESWDGTRRRKPGPASRPRYYVINPKWRVPRHLKLPYTTDMPKMCRVHLSPFPPNIMQLIHEHQPNLKLDNLYA